jgi:Uma2 family endonuclease
MQIQLEQIVVQPGQQVLMRDVSWEMYEAIAADLTQRRGTRINYSQGMLEIMAPLPEHEDDKVIIADLVKIILEELDIEFRNLGSTTFKNQAMKQAVEADDCFYIKNEAAIRGKKRIDLRIDPPPDLAIEIDITARTRFNNYEVLKVPELWRFNGSTLEIDVLQNETYRTSEFSPNFPKIPLIQAIPEYLERSKQVGRNQTMRAFRTWIKEQVSGQSAEE